MRCSASTATQYKNTKRRLLFTFDSRDYMRLEEPFQEYLNPTHLNRLIVKVIPALTRLTEHQQYAGCGKIKSSRWRRCSSTSLANHPKIISVLSSDDEKNEDPAAVVICLVNTYILRPAHTHRRLLYTIWSVLCSTWSLKFLMCANICVFPINLYDYSILFKSHLMTLRTWLCFSS